MVFNNAAYGLFPPSAVSSFIIAAASVYVKRFETVMTDSNISCDMRAPALSTVITQLSASRGTFSFNEQIPLLSAYGSMGTTAPGRYTLVQADSDGKVIKAGTAGVWSYDILNVLAFSDLSAMAIMSYSVDGGWSAENLPVPIVNTDGMIFLPSSVSREAPGKLIIYTIEKSELTQTEWGSDYYPAPTTGFAAEIDCAGLSWVNGMATAPPLEWSPLSYIPPLALVISIDAYNSSGDVRRDARSAQGYFAEIAVNGGVVRIVPVDESIYNARAAYEGKVVEFAVEDNGDYVFEVAAPDNTSKGWLVNTGITAIENGAVFLTGSGGSSVALAGPSTKFIVMNYETVGGIRVPDGTVTIYSGINQVPSLTVDGGLKNTFAVSYDAQDGVDPIADVVYVCDDVLGLGDPEKPIPPIALVTSIVKLNTVVGGEVVPVFTASIIDATGAVHHVPVDISTYIDVDEYLSKIVVYDVDGEGLYSFAEAAPDKASNGWLINTGMTSIENGSIVLSGSGGGNVALASNSTKFVVVNFKDSNGIRLPTGTVTIYNGVDLVPNLTGRSGMDFKTTYAVSYGEPGNVDTIAEIVYIFDDVYYTVKTDYVFITGNWQYIDNVYEVELIIRGNYYLALLHKPEDKDALVSEAGNLLDEVNAPPGYLYYSHSALELTPLSDISNVSGLLLVNNAFTGLTIKDYTPVYVMTIPPLGLSDTTAVTKTAFDYKAKAYFDNAEIYVYHTAGQVNALYIIVDERI